MLGDTRKSQFVHTGHVEGRWVHEKARGQFETVHIN